MDDYHKICAIIAKKYSLDTKEAQTIEIYAQTAAGDPCPVPFKSTDNFLTLREILTYKSKPVIYYKLPSSPSSVNAFTVNISEDDDVILSLSSSSDDLHERYEFLKNNILLLKAETSHAQSSLDELTSSNSVLTDTKNTLHSDLEIRVNTSTTS